MWVQLSWHALRFGKDEITEHTNQVCNRNGGVWCYNLHFNPCNIQVLNSMTRIIREIEEVLDLDQCKAIILEWVKNHKKVDKVMSESVSVFPDGVLVQIKDEISHEL